MAAAQTEEIVPGATHELVTPAGIPTIIHLVEIDLTATELSFEVTPSEARGQTVTDFADETGAHIAINGGPFSPVGFSPHGLAVGDGAAWPDSDPEAGAGAVALARIDLTTEARVEAPAQAPAPDAPLDGAVAGAAVLVDAGSPRTDFDCDDGLAIACERAPRSAAAVAEDGTVLWLTIAEGWTADSEGATAAELADFLASRGAASALLLDSGSAPALVAEPLGGLVSEPSEGAERRVANHLAVSFEELDPGEMTVLVRDSDVYDPDADLADATVTLDDGTSAVTGQTGEARFGSLRPRRVCATAEADGFEAATRCRQVPPGEAVLTSIALTPQGGESAASPAPGGSGAGDENRATAHPAPAGCQVAAGRLHGERFRATLGTALAAALFAVILRRREGGLRRRLF